MSLASPKILDLLRKYDVPGPRYTSYPTVPAWTDPVQETDYEKALRSLKTGETLSLYFHLPFCENLCHFCGCTQVITKDRSRSATYLNYLLAEVDRVVSLIPSKARDVSQIHFGGGTPNFFQPEEMATLMGKIRETFNVLSDAEVAIEMHPRTSTQAFCQKLKVLGFNRISLGVQDLDPVVQKLINRHQTYEMTQAMVNELRGLGFDSFNFDLVYGLPGQTLEGWEKTLQQVLHLKPNRLAVYSYAHVPWVRPVQRTFEDSDLPTPAMKLELFEKAYKTFTQNGYRLIGMDHFALEDDELSKALANGTIHRNFMGYSTKADAHQIGFGMSAISFVAGNYFQNQKNLKEYGETVQSGHLTVFRGCLLNHDDALRRDLITQIMCTARVDIPAFEKKWRISFQEMFGEGLSQLKTFVDDGLLALSDKEFKVTGQGFLFLRNMAMVFDAHLDRIRSQAKNPTFSRTV